MSKFLDLFSEVTDQGDLIDRIKSSGNKIKRKYIIVFTALKNKWAKLNNSDNTFSLLTIVQELGELIKDI